MSFNGANAVLKQLLLTCSFMLRALRERSAPAEVGWCAQCAWRGRVLDLFMGVQFLSGTSHPGSRPGRMRSRSIVTGRCGALEIARRGLGDRRSWFCFVNY